MDRIRRVHLGCRPHDGREADGDAGGAGRGRAGQVDLAGPGMPEFKYRDYYSVFGLENAEFVTPADATGLDAILEKMGCYERPGLEEVKARLLASFPFGGG